MRKEWYTAAEIMQLRLAAMPKTERAIQIMAKREEWATAHKADGQALSRKRSGRGGGREYHYFLFPQSARDELSLREIKNNTELVQKSVKPAQELAPVDKEVERLAKLEIVNAWEAYRAKNSDEIEIMMSDFCCFYSQKKISALNDHVYQTIKSFTTRTLRNWVKSVKTKGADGVLDTRGRKKGTSVLATAYNGVLAESIKAWIAKESKLTVRQIRDFILTDYGDQVEIISPKTGEITLKSMPSEREFSRYIKEFKDSNKALIAKITNPDQYKSHFRMAIGRHDEDVTIPNQIWEFDASPADILLVDGRYSIYALVDVATRRMLILVTKTPRTSAALHLVRIAIEKWGMPEWIRSDNGSDFVSYGMRSALAALGIHHDVCPPYSPEKKPMVERGIGTLQRDLMPTLKGFVGHNVTDRKEIESRRSFAKRLGEDDKNIFCAEMTADDLQIKCDDWAEIIYANHPHSGLKGLTPNQAYRQYDGPIHVAEDKASLALLMAPVVGQQGYRTVTKKGIRIKPKDADETLYYWGTGLDAGEKVFCRFDPLDDARIAVFKEDQSEFICMAECLNYMSGDALKVTAKQAKTEQTQRLSEDYKKMRRAADNIDLSSYADKRRDYYKAREAEKNVADLPKRTITFTTPEMDAAAEAFGGSKRAINPDLKDSFNERRKALVIDLEAKQQKTKPQMMTAAQRFSRALDLEKAIMSGEEIKEAEIKWLKIYSQSTEYKSRQQVLKEFPQQSSQSEAG